MARKPGLCKYEERNYELIYSSAETRTDNFNLGQLLEELRLGKIQDDMSMQRDADQWGLKDKSMLVHTVFLNLSIFPISLMQKGTGGGMVKLLSDGKQRLSIFDQFKNNEFALSSVTPHVRMRRVVCKPKLDEDGKEVKELIEGKRRVVMVPCLDENDKVITEEFDYKVAGKFYDELPDSLKYQFLAYKNMPQYVHINYSDEEIQMQMLRDNTSVKMTPAQIGAVLCGDELAQWQRDFREHDLFLNLSTWTDKQENRSLIERCVIESFVLTMTEESWNQNYIKNVETFKQYASKDMLASFMDIVDDLAEAVRKFPDLKQFLTKDNLHIIIATFSKFCDLPIRCDREVFGRFLCDWFAEIKDCVDYEIEGNTGTKLKTTVLGKLAIINEECKKYVITKEDSYTSVEFGYEVKSFLEEFISTQIPHNTKETALKTLMQFTSYPIRDFSDEGVVTFEHWLSKENIPQEILEDCALSTCSLRDYLNNAGAAHKFSANDIAILIHRIYADGEDLDQDAFELWLDEFENTNHCEASGSNNALLEKEGFMKNSYETFIRENNKGE